MSSDLNLSISPRTSASDPARRYEDAMLFVDISGFSALSKRLTEQGAGGTERISLILNACFDTMIAAIDRAGGEVIKFAGDALLAVWKEEADRDPASCVRKAAECGLFLQRALHRREMLPGLPLSLRVCLSAGRIEACPVDGSGRGRELVLAGEPFVQLRACSPHTEAGKVLLSEEAYARVRHQCEAEPSPGSGGAFVARFHAGAEAGTETALDSAEASGPFPAGESGRVDWEAEMRTVSVLFIHLPDFHERLDAERLRQTAEAIRLAAEQHGATVHKLSLDDKGCSAIAATGLPAYTHENDAARAVKTAMAVRQRLTELGAGFSIGLATGLVFYGSIGNASKREFTMIGDTMNLAARLMQLAPAGTVLCDSATCDAAGPAIRFQAAETVHPKGMPGPIKVYSPLGLTEPQGVERRSLVGRTAETALLERHLERLLQGEGGVVCLMGEAGIGKSLLLRQAQLEAERRGATVLYGEADAIEQRTPYYPWRSLFVALLRLAAAPEGSELRYEQALRIIHEATEDSRHLVPLLSEVLPFEIPDNEWTRQMTGQIRADNLHALVIRLMKRFMGDAPFVLMLDDAHWIDSSTWALLFAVSQQLPQALILVASRPDGEHLHLRDLPLLKLPSATVIRLGELSPDETFELIANRLSISRLSEAVGSFISEKAEGHPFFIEELAYALRDSGFIEIENGECRFARQTDDLRELDFPTTIQGIIRSRIDRLPADEQLVLKVASVIGRAFPYYALHGTMPMPTEHDRLEGHLARLTEASLTLREEAETEPSYLFKHVITQQVSYNMLVHSQRKQLHRALAVWYEKRHADASSLYGVLAYHWSRAEHPDKTVYYLEKVGLQALRTGAYKEAVHVFSELVNGQAVPASAETSARWHRLLGEAYMGIGDMAQASERIGQALTLHGRPAASTSKQFKRDVAAQVVRQLVHRTLPSRFIEKPAGSREWLLEQALCYWRLAEIAFFSNMAADNLYHSLHAINLAERAGPSAELAQISGNMCVTAGIMSLHPLAKAYIKQATQAAERTDDLSAKAWVSMDLSLYYIGIGQWSLSKRYSEQSMGIYEKMGDRRYWEASSYLMVKALAYHDADFGKSSALAEAIYSSGRASGNAQAQSWGLLALAENALYEGRAEDGIRHLTKAEALIPVNIGRTEEIRLYNLSALAYIKTGRAEQAKHYAGLGLPLTTASKPTTYYAFDGYAALVEALLALWNSPGEDRAYYRSSLGEAMKSLEGFAKVFPIALPRFHAFAGIVAGCEGDFGKARKSWSRSLRLARKLAMPYEIGWTEAEIRRFTP